VFGSATRGDASESSEVNFLVGLAEGRRLFDLGALPMDLRDLLGGGRM
jgi:predicted nucleotidyltransferase